MSKSPYLRLGYRPNYKEELVVSYYLESKLPLAEAAAHIAAESSIGTWTKLGTLKEATLKKLGPKIFKLDNKKKTVHIAYPLALFELGNITQLLSALAGNVFSMKVIANLRLLDIQFPKKYLDSFRGPAFGIEGVRRYLKIYKRPIIGSIIKPKVGLSAKEQARLAYQIWKNGVDLVKDDENLTDMVFNKFEERVKEVMKLKKQVEQETGEKKVYVFNVTGPADVMLKRAKLVKKYGGKVAMIDLVVAGLDNIQFLREQNLGLILHGHRAGHSMFTKNSRHGMTMLLLAKLARLTGIDQLHTGTVVGKMEGTAEEVTEINLEMEEDWFGVNKEITNWEKIKPVLPIASGGLHPGLVEKLVKILGADLVINFGGGLHGHPDGSIAGARACRQSVEAVVKKIPAKIYAETRLELKRALEYWKLKK
ncbi:type III ribulose-bisphosphate carboxylase [Candidatus Kuenenbacteria bacterium]|nr:type III ribulose-bisphosphate carboxylase [Candidatus Kuenenbacteria bacterium]